MASFYIIRGRDHGQHFAIRGAVTTIGRDSSNPIKINDTEVSRRHATVSRSEDGEFEIRDNSSSNGTFVNSHKIEKQTLHSGDRVQLGRTLMIFTGGPEPHSTRSLDGVEIVAQRDPQELSQIRSSIESQVVSDLWETADQQRSWKDAATSNSVNISEVVSSEPNESWEIVYQVSQAITRTVDLDDLLEQVLELIFQWVQCDRGCVMMLDDVTGQLIPKVTRDRKQSRARKSSSGSKEHRVGESPEPSTPRRMQISRSILEHVVDNREGVLTSNAQNDARWENVESIESLGVHEALCVPMLGRYGLVGAIYVDTQRSAGQYVEQNQQACFDETHLKLLLSIAQQAALAVEDTQFYQAMLQSERLATMGQTIANLSHHVKNILQGIGGGSYLVDDGLHKGDLEVIQKGWGIVQRNQARITNLVMDMLSFSKEREAELVTGDLVALVREIVDLMSSRASDAGVKLIGPKTNDTCSVPFDAEAMHRAILNVLTNAIDAAASSEHLKNEAGESTGLETVSVEVELDTKNRLASVSITDNGDGIPEDQSTRIFSPFESSKGAKGTGLGLPVSLKVLREHGGDIQVESKVDHGTTFRLYWPLESEPNNELERIDETLPG